MRIALSSRVRLGGAAIILGVCAACLFVPGDNLAAVGLRCGAVLVIMARGAAWLRDRAAGRAIPLPLSGAGRCSLGREPVVAMLCADGRRWVVGYGRDGVSLIADLGDAP